MPAPRARPTVILAGRVPIEVDERRRRLQERLGCGVADLMTIALERLEADLLRCNTERHDNGTGHAR